MKSIFTLLCLVVVGCQPAAQQGAPGTPGPPAAGRAAAPPRDPPAQTAAHFLAWYRPRLLTAGRIDFIDNANGRDPAKFYRVNFPKTEVYLAGLQESGYVSAAYLDTWRRYFRRWDDSLRLHPHNEGPPLGFDFDLVTNSQEPSLYLDSVAQAHLATAYPGPQRAVVTADFADGAGATNRRLFYLRQYPAGWLIDSLVAK